MYPNFARTPKIKNSLLQIILQDKSEDLNDLPNEIEAIKTAISVEADLSSYLYVK